MYENILVLSPEGEALHQCAKEKAEWYIKKGLALPHLMMNKGAAQELEAIRLTKHLSFTPANPFYIQERKNICVVCGTDKDLTRHHIIPQCYTKYFTKHFDITNSSHDIVLICHKHHKFYEHRAMCFKNKIFKENGIDYTKIGKITKYANTLYSGRPFKNHWEKDNLTRTIKEYLGRDYTYEDLKAIVNQPSPYERLVMSIPKEQVPKFYQRWRQHFVNVVQPRYMPDHWTVEGKWV